MNLKESFHLTYTLYKIARPLVLHTNVFIPHLASPSLPCYFNSSHVHPTLLTSHIDLQIRFSPHRCSPVGPMLLQSFEQRSTSEDVVQRRRNGQSNSSPTSLDNLGILETNTHIPGQMPQSIDAVEEEGEGKEAL